MSFFFLLGEGTPFGGSLGRNQAENPRQAVFEELGVKNVLGANATVTLETDKQAEWEGYHGWRVFVFLGGFPLFFRRA